jgi:carbon-monoxide dehydrogenase medium subunit
MRDFDFLQPASVAEASRMLADLGDDCRVMAGGTALMLVMRQRMLTPTHVVSAAKLDACAASASTRSAACASARWSATSTSPNRRSCSSTTRCWPRWRRRWPIRRCATRARWAATSATATRPPIRPAACWRWTRRWCWAAHAASACCRSESSWSTSTSRRSSPTKWWSKCACRRRIRGQRRLHALSPHRRRTPAAGQRVAAGAARRRLCQSARIVVGASVPVPRRLPRAEEFLRGKTVTPDVAAEAADIVAADIEPIDDLRGSKPRTGARWCASTPAHHRRPVRPRRKETHEHPPHPARRQRRAGQKRRSAGAPPAVATSCATTCTSPAPSAAARPAPAAPARCWSTAKSSSPACRWRCRPRASRHHGRRPRQGRGQLHPLQELHAVRRPAMRLLHARLPDGVLRLLARNPSPRGAGARRPVGNLCRCTGYYADRRIGAAAAEKMRGN